MKKFLLALLILSFVFISNAALTQPTGGGPIHTGGAPPVPETDSIVGAVTGIVKADGAGNISAAVADTDYESALADSNVRFVDISESIETVHDAATAGDSLVLAAGTYTVTDDIDITKSISITGQGRGLTKIVCVTDTKNVFDVSASDVTIQDLSIDITASGTLAIKVDGTAILSGILIKDVDITRNSHAGPQDAIQFVDTNGEIRDVVIVATSSSAACLGVEVKNTATADAVTVVKCYNVDVSLTAAGGTSEGFFSYDNGATSDVSLYLYSCTSYVTGSTDYAAIASSPDAYLYAENCVFAGDDADIVNSASAGIVQLRNCTLVNGTTSGTITWDGTAEGEETVTCVGDACAEDITKRTHFVVSDGGGDTNADALALDDGTITGQTVTFVFKTETDVGDTIVIDSGQQVGWGDFTMAEVGDSVTFVWDGTNWTVESDYQAGTY